MTKQTKAEELWDRFCFDSDGVPLMMKGAFMSALAEYGQEVRRRDAEVCRKECLVDGLDTSDDIAYNLAVSDCAAAIEREKMP